MTDEFWIPLVDESIGEIVAQLESEDAGIRELLDSPQKLLAFRTFANIRAGIMLGRLLVERDEAPPGDDAETWVAKLAREPEVRDELLEELRDVAEQLAAENDEEPAAPDAAARERFRSFARRALVDE